MRGYIRRRPNGRSWQLAVHVGRDENGRKQYVYETVEGTKREAEARLAALVTRASTGRLAVPTKMTVADLADAWWETTAPELSPHTRVGYRGLLDRRILPALGRRPVAKVRTDTLERFYGSLRDGTAPGGGALGARSIHNVHTIVSGMFSAALRWGWVDTNPAERARKPKARVGRPNAPEPDVVERLLDAARADDEAFGVFLRVSVAAGTRRGETAALRWSDLDLENGAIAVQRALAPEELDGVRVSRGGSVEKGTKTHQVRMISIDEGTVAALRGLYESRAVLARGVGAEGVDAESYVFSDDPAGAVPWKPDTLTKRFAVVRKRAGVTGVRLHDLRHYHGTMLADLGVPLSAVRDRLGHSDLRTTSIYAHGRRATDQVAAELMGRHLDGSKPLDAEAS
jgi:integrase